jgi:RES domain-containing protein
MILYRIANCQYITRLDGEGARIYGARWNSEGKAMVYLASSRALAVLEVLVHLPPVQIPDNYCIVEVEVPDAELLTLDATTLPDNWKDISPPAILKLIGDRFLKDNKYLMMKVPSSVVEQEPNYLLNPLHPDMEKVRILNKQPFSFDLRLIQ